MKTASAVLQDLSLFVTLTFQIEEQKKKKKNSSNSLSENKQIRNHFLCQLFPKTSFLAAGLLVGEFNGFDSVHSSFQNKLPA